jgi:t-SNARE complex subunit (syntaxin)
MKTKLIVYGVAVVITTILLYFVCEVTIALLNAICAVPKHILDSIRIF